MERYSTPLTTHLHEVALDIKRDFTTYVQTLVVQKAGQDPLAYLTDGGRWHNVPGTEGIAVKHIERHPEDPDNAAALRATQHAMNQGPDCPAALPHMSTFFLKAGTEGVFIAQYDCRLTLITGMLCANGAVVTAHDRRHAEYQVRKGVSVELRAEENCYSLVKYFPSLDEVGNAEAGPTLHELVTRQKSGGHEWFQFFANGTEPWSPNAIGSM